MHPSQDAQDAPKKKHDRTFSPLSDIMKRRDDWMLFSGRSVGGSRLAVRLAWNTRCRSTIETGPSFWDRRIEG